jgi:cephalosporin hydroxylase
MAEPTGQYVEEIKTRIKSYKSDTTVQSFKISALNLINRNEYAYNFRWLGRPIIQLPQDTVTFQELIWDAKPDCIIETGIAHGGSLIFSASMLSILDACDLVKSPIVIGIDIDIRKHNRHAIESHPLNKYVRMFESSSTDPAVYQQIKEIVGAKKSVMVFLDSNHTHSHVLEELRLYSQLVTLGGYCVVLDTGIEDIDPLAVAENRPWCKGNSPKSALKEFLASNNDFVIDEFYEEKALVTSFSDGIIKRVR